MKLPRRRFLHLVVGTAAVPQLRDNVHALCTLVSSWMRPLAESEHQNANNSVLRMTGS